MCETSKYQEIYVLGPSSSGKTTLCDALSQRLDIRDPLYIKEVARRVMAAHGFTRDDTDTYEMQHAIMRGQLDAECTAIKHIAAASNEAEQSGRLMLLSDRSAIDPIVYAATSLVPGASSRRQRLLEDAGFQRTLPRYRRALFGE